MTSGGLFIQQSVIKNDAVIWVILYGPNSANTHETIFMQDMFYAKFSRDIQGYKKAQKKNWF